MQMIDEKFEICLTDYITGTYLQGKARQGKARQGKARQGVAFIKVKYSRINDCHRVIG